MQHICNITAISELSAYVPEYYFAIVLLDVYRLHLKKWRGLHSMSVQRKLLLLYIQGIHTHMLYIYSHYCIHKVFEFFAFMC